jgi:hypothetical protein
VFLEGMTQYFTIQLLTEGALAFAHPHTAYDAAVLAAAEVAKNQGEETVRHAFFGGEPFYLRMLGL